ncbi:type I-MYXAN CRISPR-associated protein Cas6/Cmx6 [Myxococcota bacterium]|nr:type I-MYXAN CRISPR-associated protein Cas6/Cmx6 [Myxococcota bacterium]
MTGEKSQKSIVEMVWSAHGTEIPADHGYPVYGAVSRHVPWVHENKEASILPLTGQPIGNRLLSLSKDARFRVRVPYEGVAEMYRLSGKRLDLNGYSVRLGVPELSLLRASRSLYSRLVVIKGYTEETAFLEAIQRQLTDMGVLEASPSIPLRTPFDVERLRQKGFEPSLTCRRTLRVKNKEIVGFAVRVDNLSDGSSILLQAAGLGGKRLFGCGCFVPFVEGA